MRAIDLNVTYAYGAHACMCICVHAGAIGKTFSVLNSCADRTLRLLLHRPYLCLSVCLAYSENMCAES